MAEFVCGFFNSIDGDRKYNAEQMNNPYYRLVSNGIFANTDGSISTDFEVIKDTSISDVIVKQGNGIFFDKWAKLDGNLTLDMYTPDVVYDRIDSVVVRIDKSDEVRAGSIIIKKGVPASTPTAPKLDRTSMVKEYRLANIYIPANATSIIQITITDTRGTSECGWIKSLVYQDTVVNVARANYTTTADNEKIITVPIAYYNPLTDSLLVYINGLLLAENIDYTLSGNSVVLTLGVDKGTILTFVVYGA